MKKTNEQRYKELFETALKQFNKEMAEKHPDIDPETIKRVCVSFIDFLVEILGKEIEKRQEQ